MSSKRELHLARPPAVQDPISIDFMIRKLAESGLEPRDLDAYPVKPDPLGNGGFCIPYSNPAMYRIRYDRVDDKYKQPEKLVETWWSPKHDITKFSSLPDIYIIEGELKAAAFVKRFGLPTFGLGGCWNFRDKDGASPRLLADIQQAIRKGSRVHVIFDGDIQTNTNVSQAAHALAGYIEEQHGSVFFYKPPLGKGVDDWLVADLQAVVDHLVPVDKVDLEIGRKQLFERLELKMDDGKLILNEINAQRLLKHYYDKRLNNDRRLGVIYEGNPTNDIDRLADDSLQYLQESINARWSQSKVATGFRMALREFSSDHVQNMVRTFKWDGTPRLDTWGSEYLATDFPAYANEWGRILLTGMTLRILKPGTKFDYACILAGPQGIGKSTFFEDLSEIDGYKFYTALTAVSATSGDSNRTQATMLKKNLIVDLAEGVVFETKKHSIDTLKQFLSQTSDEYREVYSKSTTTVDRGCIFVGTTNRFDQLSDQTGSRRFLNLAVQKIHRLPYIIKAQIMAEVVAKEEELLKQEWWEIKVPRELWPTSYISEETAHISNVQDIVNAQFHRANSIDELVESCLDSEKCAKVRGMPHEGYFISANYVTSQTKQEGDFGSKNMISRNLSALSQSPTFKWKLTLRRLRAPQLECDEKTMMCYTDGINNAQAMLVGYTAKRK